jgi:hypothetical protein
MSQNQTMCKCAQRPPLFHLVLSLLRIKQQLYRLHETASQPARHITLNNVFTVLSRQTRWNTSTTLDTLLCITTSWNSHKNTSCMHNWSSHWQQEPTTSKLISFQIYCWQQPFSSLLPPALPVTNEILSQIHYIQMDTYVLTPLQRTTTSVPVPAGTVQMDSSIPHKYCEGISTIVRYCTSTGDTSSTVLQQLTSFIQCMVSYEYNTGRSGPARSSGFDWDRWLVRASRAQIGLMRDI